MKTAIWFKNDLRIHDNAALCAAIKNKIDGENLSLAIHCHDCTANPIEKTILRQNVEMHLLNHLAQVFSTHSIPFYVKYGPSVETIIKTAKEYGIEKIYAHQETSEKTGFDRDRFFKAQCNQSNIEFIEIPEGSVQRGKQNKFAISINNQNPLAQTSEKIWENTIFDSSYPNILDQSPINKLKNFLESLPNVKYGAHMWAIDTTLNLEGAVTSQLSTLLSCGGLSIERALCETRRASVKYKDAETLKAFRQFEARLNWRQSFKQIYETQWQCFPDRPTRESRSDDTNKLKAWLNGQTGIPMCDAAMRELQVTGFVNFRLRQIISSMAIDLLDLDWFVAGCELGTLFNDYEPGIHWNQMALQAGQWKGRGPRIINPVKQGYDLDKSENYIRKWIPELSSVPSGFGHEPWKIDSHHYMKPILDVKKAMKTAKERYPSQSIKKSEKEKMKDLFNEN